jgi:hypothetical protein
MALSSENRLAIRKWVGSDPDDTELESYFDALGDAPSAALQILQERLADFEGSPVQMGIDGDWRQNHQANLVALQDKVRELEAIVAPDDRTDGVVVGTMTRTRLDER